MSATALILTTVLTGSVMSTGAVEYFPGNYYHTHVRERFQRQVKASWPGPTELMRMWDETELTEEQRVALLLGGAVFHDPVMLPAYRQAVQSKSQRLRQAAIYGYHDLLADLPPNVDVTIDDGFASSYAEDIHWVRRTLRSHSLLAFWLQSALAHEGRSLPGYDGVRLTRPKRECFRAAERLVEVWDLDLLVTAYEQSRDRENRIAMLRLIESVSLSRFVIMPKGAAGGWGTAVFEAALRSLGGSIRRWQHNGCTVDGVSVLRQNLRLHGATVQDPLAPEACGLWLEVLRQDAPQWWLLAARRLYACGGPWVELSALQPDSDSNRDRRDRLIEWYSPRRPSSRRPGGCLNCR
jgi:hypothetical protein